MSNHSLHGNSRGNFLRALSRRVVVTSDGPQIRLLAGIGSVSGSLKIGALLHICADDGMRSVIQP